MEHFSLEQWADFARGMVGEDKKAVMQTHLESGCKSCATVLNTWTRVRKVAKRESMYQPPEGAVRTVKGMGAIHARPMRPSIARLLFDSSESRVPAGVRSTSTVARQLLYGVGTYRIDLRMEPQMDSDKVSLVGQILNSTDPTKYAVAVPVVLLKGRQTLAESQTNGFGEFHLECNLEGRLQLQLVLPPGTELRIPLVEPAKGAVSRPLDSIESSKVRRTASRRGKGTRKRV